MFIAKGRKGHNHYQVYEKDLESGAERRITFQNGDTYFPEYHPKKALILYSSSTDELKENPPLLTPEQPTTKLPALFQSPVEVYSHSLDGLEITRLTSHSGFDGEARFSHDGQTIYWTRARGEKLESLAMNATNKAIRNQKGLGVNVAQYTVSPDGKVKAWVDWDESFGVAKLKVQKGKDKAAEIVPDLVVPKTDLTFTPDSKWLLWAQLDTPSSAYQLWSLEIETLCARRLTDNTGGDRRFPAVSPDGKRLVFASVKGGRSRIAQASFSAPAGPCVASP